MPSVPEIATLVTVPEPLPEAAMVMASVDGSVVMVILEPATNVSVSFVESATMLLCPETAIVPKRFWSPVFVPESVPLAPSAIVMPLFWMTLPLVPSNRTIWLSRDVLELVTSPVPLTGVDTSTMTDGLASATFTITSPPSVT